MTLEEKIDLLGGFDRFYIRDVPRVGIPRMKMADGPVGLRNYGNSNAMPSTISLASTWNLQLAESYGRELARDSRARGVHYLLAPGVNIYRAPMNGRNFEYFGEDPFLTSRFAVNYINGVQSQNVSATVKHFIANNSEFDRHETDSVIDERTMREIYLPAFEAAVKEAQVGSIMDSYNLVNGVHTSQSGYLNNEIAKKEWGFDGVIMSDWRSTYDGVAAANGGLDLEMPAGEYMNRQTLLPAIQQGKVSEATIDDKVRRILRVAARFGWFDHEQTDTSIPLYNAAGRQIALQTAREGIVLLKNQGNLLPLDKKKIKAIAVIGPNAYPAITGGGGSSLVEPFNAVSLLEGLANIGGLDVKVTYAKGLPTLSELAEKTNFTVEPNGEAGLRHEYFSNDFLEGTPDSVRVDNHINFGSVIRVATAGPADSSRWTGWFMPKEAGIHDFFVQNTGLDGGFYRLKVDDNLVINSWEDARAAIGQISLKLDAKPHKIVLERHGATRWIGGGRLRFGIVPRGSFVSAEAKKLAAEADAVVIAAGFEPESETERCDRTFGLPVGQDELIKELSAINKNAIVVLNAGGGVDMNPWLERVPALLHAWYPGQEGGTALAEILFGEVNPSGRLPITIEKRWEDNPTFHSYYPVDNSNRVVYQEGIFVGYRGYEHNGTKPLFPFGYGLIYTSFKYKNLTIKPVSEGVYDVSFAIQNIGTRKGTEVAQVYVGNAPASVPRPAKELKGFAKIELNPGETKSVTVRLNKRAFTFYDVNAKGWKAETGEYGVLVGKSTEQIELRGKINLNKSFTEK